MLSGRDARRLEPDRRARGSTAATARRGRASASPTSRRSSPRAADRVPYAELHCHSNFSFLDGASHPEELVEQAAPAGPGGDRAHRPRRHVRRGPVRRGGRRAGGAPRCSAPSCRWGSRPRRTAWPIPEGSHLLLLARDPEGYRALCRTISAAQLRGKEKGRPVYDLDEVVAETAGQVLVLTGCRKGAVAPGAAPRRPRRRGRGAARGWCERFGAEHVAVELTHAGPAHRHRAERRARRARGRRGRCPRSPPRPRTTPPRERFPLATALAAVRARRSLDEADGWLPARGHRAPAVGGGDGGPVRAPPPGRGGAGGGVRARSARSRSSWWRRTCRRSTCRRGTPRRAGCAQLTCRGVARRYGSYAEYPEAVRDGASASWRSSSRRTSPATS